MNYKKMVLTVAVGALSVTMTAQTAPQLNANNIEEVIKAMTLEEKAQLLVGGGNDGFVGSGAMLGHQKKFVPGAAGTTVAIPRLGIPATVQCDGPAGVHIDAHREGDSRNYYATGFPVGTCLASTWNTDLVRKVGEAIGNETLEYGCDVVLGPGMNLHRNPLCGRNFEYYSEDPVVTGLMGTAFVLGVQSQGVGVSAKHFAVNSQESDRTRVDERLSQRALRELYLKGFEMMVRKSNPWTIMSAYNKVNGVYAQGNKDLLTNILRNDWGYKGIVETDWIGKREDLPVEQEVAAGNDLMMPGYPAQVKDIVNAVKSGKLDVNDVDRNVRRMLEYIVKTPRFKGYKYSGEPDLKAHAAITRQSSTEGMVLLKNNAALPIRGLKTVALFGVNSYDFMSGGLGSGAVNVGYSVDMVTGLKNIGVATTPQLTEIYQNYVKYAKAKLKADKNPMMWFLNQGQPKLDEIDITERCVANEEPKADAAIITIGRQAGEGMDRQINGEFNLSKTEQDMIFRVSDAFHAKGKKVIVIINSGSVMETASWRDRVDAILVAWQPGIEGGNSVADILTGKVNPSGKLTMTWPIAATDHPSTANFAKEYDMYTYKNMEGWGKGNIPGVDFSNHEEDIYVGYRYFDTFKKDVAYPFGFGLSYTTFEMGKPSVKTNGKNIEVSVTIKNTGKVAGKQVAQVYVTAPKGAYEKPAKELKAFGKTRELKPGESQTLKMTLEKRDLASFDEANSQWKVDAGNYLFQVGTDVESIKGTATLKVAEYTEKTSSACAPNVQLNYLKQK
ncbi:glycoside hydrolase family 3 C-terminal domain-containing protein [Prevotella copri]|uniref:beta-glucosidase n=2 Tax=Prevotellaceae TaxID=171552 RepID=UPI001C3892BD|nr:glycoside hydrolase family 3 C-terminal domain-containing protein [Segatella copri]MBV3412990.1 glycoside hydrolase family 3 C-terminal domain-containing protein [Segatella copri]